MKKMVIILGVLACALFLGGCTAEKKNDAITNSADALGTQFCSKIEQLNDMRQNTEPETQNDQVSESDLEGQNDRGSGSNLEMQVLQLGGMGNLDMGFLVCAVPDKVDEDYKLCFFFWRRKWIRGYIQIFFGDRI